MLVWVFITGTLWIRKAMLVVPNFVFFTFLLLTTTTAEETVETWEKWKSIMFYFLFLCLALYISWANEL